MNKQEFSGAYPRCHEANRIDGVWNVESPEMETIKALEQYPGNITVKMVEEDLCLFTAFFTVLSADGERLGFMQGIPDPQTKTRREHEEIVRKTLGMG